MIEVVCPDFVKKFGKILGVENFDFEKINILEKFDEIAINENEIIFPRLK